MIKRDIIAAKATNPTEQSDSIVVSFGAEWHQHMLAKDFSIVIRKRVPKHDSYKWLYFHINNPVSAICGRAEIKKTFTANKSEALSLVREINLSSKQIEDYIGTDARIGCYLLGTFELGRVVQASTLATRLAYYPPQSFFILAKQAKKIVDQFAGFAAPNATKSRSGGKL